MSNYERGLVIFFLILSLGLIILLQLSNWELRNGVTEELRNGVTE